MPDNEKKHQNENDAFENFDFNFDENSIPDLLKNIDMEKLNSLIQNLSPKLNKRNNKVEVLSMLKEFLPDDKNQIIDIFISILGGR